MKTLGGEDALQLVLFEVALRRAPSCPPTFDRYRTTTFQVMQEKAAQTSNGVLLVDGDQAWASQQVLAGCRGAVAAILAKRRETRTGSTL